MKRVYRWMSGAAASGAAIAVAALTVGGGAAHGESAAPARQASAGSFAVINEMRPGSSQLSPSQRAALSGLGKGFIAGRSGSPDATKSSAQAIADGDDAVTRVDHPAGITMVLARAGGLVCFNDAPTRGGVDSGGGCAPAAMDPAAPPASVTTDDEEERVVALLPDGAHNVTLASADGTTIPVTVVDNVAATRAASARELRWTDANGASQKLRFHIAADNAASRSRAVRARKSRRITGG